MAGVVVQYIVVRRDLLEKAVVAVRGCYCPGVPRLLCRVTQTQDDADCQQYLEKLDSMHKVILQIPDEEKLRQLSNTLLTDGIDHKLWIEQPEDTATCLATKPCQKQSIQHYFKKLKLFK